MQLNINHQSNNEFRLAISNNETAISTNQFVAHSNQLKIDMLRFYLKSEQLLIQHVT